MLQSHIFAAAILLVEIPSFGAENSSVLWSPREGARKALRPPQQVEDSPWKIQPLKKDKKRVKDPILGLDHENNERIEM